MAVVRKYQLPPTSLIPNSPRPLLHYTRHLSDKSPVAIWDLLRSNGWQVQWIFRYGPTQQSHYHSEAHECMVVLTGTAKIRFGVADAEDGGIVLDAAPGDVFILPAGLAHKTFDAEPVAEFKLLSPGDPREVDDEQMRVFMEGGKLSGFTMMGAYPGDGSRWDFAVGGESEGGYDKVWAVPVPAKDPVMGLGGGLLEHWMAG